MEHRAARRLRPTAARGAPGQSRGGAASAAATQASWRPREHGDERRGRASTGAIGPSQSLVRPTGSVSSTIGRGLDGPNGLSPKTGPNSINRGPKQNI